MARGFRWRRGKIEIETKITQSYVSLVVRNAKGVRFDIKKICERQYRLLTDNPQSPRGRGLLNVKELADELLSMEDGRSIKAVLYSDCVRVEFYKFENLAVFKLVSGL